jgi:extracellular elastinolytic metalloproteinase
MATPSLCRSARLAWAIAQAEGAQARRSSGRLAACAAVLVAALLPASAEAQEPARPAVDARAAAAPAPPPSERERAARRRLRRSAVLSVDARTGTVRSVQGRDGPLTEVAAGDRSAVALGWVREQRAALGLSAGDVESLELAERSVTPATRITHLRYRQSDRGIPAFDGGLRVSLDRGGRILSVAGSPLTGLAAGSTVPRLDAVAALRAVGDVRAVDVVAGPSGVRRTTRFAGGGLARLVLFGSGRGTRLAWHVVHRDQDAVVDAASGAILFRQSLTASDGAALVFPSHPGLQAASPIDLEDEGWITASAGVLSGPYARAYSDLNGNDAPSGSAEEIERTVSGDFQYGFTPFAGSTCSTSARCSWNPAVANSWSVNRQQNGVQAFYLVNRFHDHLAGDPDIGFTDATDGFSGADAVQVETNDADGLNNASMSTPPDGVAPTLQLHRFAGSGFRSANAGDSAAVVWHEYTHGLSSRLVTWSDGSAALSSSQAGAMGEGWSDWYALDLLASLNLLVDQPTPGQMDVGHYIDATPRTLRSQPLDCPVGTNAAACPHGGYTLGDFGAVGNGPDVHDDGEIWGETLWDLRGVLGSNLAQALITEGMRMSPPEPSFLDMRNAILAAEAGLPGDHRAAVWEVFRKRGMGFFAHAEDGGDVTPTQDFTAPPAPGAPQGRTTGTVTSADTGLPLGNVSVGFAGLSTQAAFSERLVARTAASGAYALDAPAGRYGELAFESAGGYDRVAVPGFVVGAGATVVQDVALRRDWAAFAGGADIVPSTRSDDSGAPFGCGLAQLIDQRGESGWSAWNPLSPDPANPATEPPVAVVRLPQAIDVSAFGVDPTNTCGNAPGASTAGYRIETSADGISYATAVQGSLSAADRGHLSVVPASVSGVRYVRLTLLSPQSAASDFIDFSELEVFGGPPNRLPTGTLAASRMRLSAGETVDFAASFTDADSKITGYDWDFDGNGSVDRSTTGTTTSFTYAKAGTFNATVAARDFRGGAGTAARTLTVTRRARPRLTLPKRGKKGRVTIRVSCELRCRVTATLRVGGRTIRRVRKTIAADARRRVVVTLPKKVRRAARRRDARTVRAVLTVTARYADGRRTTEKRTVRIRV